jgi:hypothetical protein
MMGNRFWFGWLYERILAYPSLLPEGHTYEMCSIKWIARTLGIPRAKAAKLMGSPQADLMIGQRQSPVWTMFAFDEAAAKLRKARDAGDTCYERRHAFKPRMSAKQRAEIERKAMVAEVQYSVNRRHLCSPRHVLAMDQINQLRSPGRR